MSVNACRGPGPEPELVYSLARLGGVALPVTTDAALWPDGKIHQIQVLEGRLTLGADGSIEQELHSRRAVDGVPTEDLGWMRYSGAYERSASAVLARFDMPVLLRPSGQPPDHKRMRVTVRYRASDSGRVLRGLEPAGLGAMVYEWVLVKQNPDPSR